MNVKEMELENGKKYIVFDVIEVDGKNYMLFLNEENEYDFQVRKVITKNKEKFVENINGDELVKVIQSFAKKYEGIDLK